MEAAISDRDHAAFRRDGYLVVRNVVARSRIESVLRAVNRWLNDGFDSDKLEEYHSRTFAPELAYGPLPEMLAEGPVLDLAAELVGKPIHSAIGGQLALRFPWREEWLPCDDPQGGHIDGIPTSTNGVPRSGTLHGFTLVAGILCSDSPEPQHGNFTVWPGTHLTNGAWFAEHGAGCEDPDFLLGDVPRRASEHTRPVQVCGRLGDVVFAHYLLTHTAAPHAGPHIRYMAFFRLHAKGRKTLGDAVYRDPWLEWPAIRSIGR